MGRGKIVLSEKDLDPLVRDISDFIREKHGELGKSEVVEIGLGRYYRGITTSSIVQIVDASDRIFGRVFYVDAKKGLYAFEKDKDYRDVIRTNPALLDLRAELLDSNMGHTIRKKKTKIPKNNGQNNRVYRCYIPNDKHPPD